MKYQITNNELIVTTQKYFQDNIFLPQQLENILDFLDNNTILKLNFDYRPSQEVNYFGVDINSKEERLVFQVDSFNSDDQTKIEDLISKITI